MAILMSNDQWTICHKHPADADIAAIQKLQICINSDIFIIAVIMQGCMQHNKQHMKYIFWKE